MPFDWPDFINVADALAAINDEAHKRAAISRAYNAAYGVAVKLCKVQRAPSTRHEDVWIWLKNELIAGASGETIGNAGDLLKKQRFNADYEIGTRNHDARLAIRRSKQIVHDVQKRLADLRGG